MREAAVKAAAEAAHDSSALPTANSISPTEELCELFHLIEYDHLRIKKSTTSSSFPDAPGLSATTTTSNDPGASDASPRAVTGALGSNLSLVVDPGQRCNVAVFVLRAPLP